VGVLEILDRVSDESARPLAIERVDAARCERRWWSRWEPHVRARRRVDRFLGELADGGDGPAAVVCHSLLIRSILRRHCPDDGDLARGLIPNCSVLSIDVGRDGDGALRLANPALAFNPTE
jgi:broad specificity phosphatase PhoE